MPKDTSTFWVKEFFKIKATNLEDFKFDITAQYKIVNEIDSEFPKITSHNLNENLSNIRYNVSLSYVEQHGEKSKMAE